MVIMQYGFGKVLIAAIAGYILGWVWFMPPLFGDAWKKIHKFSKKDLERASSVKTMGLGFIATLITSLALSILLSAWGAADAGTAIIVALIAWVGFVATTNLNFVLWGKEPEGAYIINALYLSVQFVVMALILAA